VSRVPPHDLQAEQSLIGSVLIRSSLLTSLSTFVDASDFYNPKHQQVWQAMLELHDAGHPVDMVTVGNKAPDVPAELLAECFNATPAVSAAKRYADIVVAAARRRKLMAHLSQLADRCYNEEADAVLNDIDPGETLLVRDPTRPLDGLSRLDDFLAVARSKPDVHDWIIPHTLKPRWRQVYVAEEGVGKGTLLRFLGVHVAAGRNPWDPRTFIEARNVLNIDVENPDSTMAIQFGLANQYVDVEAEAAPRFFVWHREGGIDVRDRRTRAELEQAVQKARPDGDEPWLVIAGPLYKLFRRERGEDMEQATIDFLSVIDDLRVRYNFAILLEHHAPKGDGGKNRVMTTFGSSALLRWPEHGIALEVVGNPTHDDRQLELRCSRFRRDREPMDFPTSIVRGSNIAWVPKYEYGRNRQGWPYPGDE